MGGSGRNKAVLISARTCWGTPVAVMTKKGQTESSEELGSPSSLKEHSEKPQQAPMEVLEKSSELLH